jgi:uncharacterized protein YbjQ (UPF0145 family)
MGGDRHPSTRRLLETRAHGPFSALGSAGGFAVARRGGLRPLTVVTGIATEPDYNFAGAYVKPGAFREGHMFNARWGAGAQRALEELRGQARLVAATAVIAITMRVDRVHVGGEPSHMIRFVLSGNAMSEAGHRAGADPVLSNFSAEEHLLLAQSGFRPVGLCVAAAKYTANMTRPSARLATRGAHPVWRRLLRAPTAPRALADASDTVSGVRHAIVRELAAQARRLHADGILNAVVDLEIPDPEISVTATRYALALTGIATAIAHTDAKDTPAPKTVLRLGDPRPPHLKPA